MNNLMFMMGSAGRLQAAFYAALQILAEISALPAGAPASWSAERQFRFGGSHIFKSIIPPVLPHPTQYPTRNPLISREVSFNAAYPRSFILKTIGIKKQKRKNETKLLQNLAVQWRPDFFLLRKAAFPRPRPTNAVENYTTGRPVEFV